MSHLPLSPVTLSITSPNMFDITIGEYTESYPAFGQYKIIERPDDKVGIMELGIHTYIVNPVPYFEWLDQAGTAYTSIDQLKTDIGLAITWGSNFAVKKTSDVISNTIKNTIDPLIDNMAVDGSGTTSIFRFTFDVDSIVTSLKIYMKDDKKFTDAEFGSENELANGCLLMIKGEPAALFKTNMDVIMESDAVTSLPMLATTDKHLYTTRNFDDKLFMYAGETIEMHIQDKIDQALEEFKLYIRGYRLY